MSIETKKKLWLNKKVISISNGYQMDPSDVSLHKGEIVDIVPLGDSKSPFPVVLYEGATEPVLSFSALIKYDEDLWQTLSAMTAKTRWNLIQAFCNRYSATSLL